MSKKFKQASIFQYEDTPLFSGVASTIQAEEFAPTQADRQDTLPGMARDWTETAQTIQGQRRRVVPVEKQKLSDACELGDHSGCGVVFSPCCVCRCHDGTRARLGVDLA